MRLQVLGDGSATLSVKGAEATSVGFLPSDGHDLRLAATVPTAVDGPPVVCLDLNVVGANLRGKAGLTDPGGAGLDPDPHDGGAPADRHGNYVTYPIELVPASTDARS